MGNRNRSAGINAEQKIAKELRELGFDLVVTTRAESKNMDDMGVDLIQLKNCKNELPCFIQVKKSINTPNIVQILQTKLEKPLIIIHKKVEKRSSRFYEIGDFVYMTKEFFYKLLNNEKQNTINHVDGAAN